MDEDDDTKVCRVCGRTFTRRARWAKDWPNVRHCSRRCRGRGLRAVDRRLEQAIVALLDERPGRTICPSEAAHRAVPDGWRDWMEAARMAARRLHHRGEAVILQRGRPVDPDHARGPIRIGRPR